MNSELSSEPASKARIADRPTYPARRRSADTEAAMACRSVLDQLLRQTVISRLRQAHPQADTAFTPVVVPVRPALPSDQGVARLVAALRSPDQAALDSLAENIAGDEAGIDGLLLDMLPLAEQQLAPLGTADAADLLAHWRLNELVEHFAPRFQAAGTVTRHARRALLSSADPAPQHLCLQICAETLSRDGWDAWCDTEGGIVGLLETVRDDWFSMLVIASGSAAVDVLALNIRALRRASLNPDLRVMVLSQALSRRPDRMARLGVDAAASDLRHAALQARRLLQLLPSQP